MRRFLRRHADPDRAGSLSMEMRRRRNERFARLLRGVPRPCTILDVGGTPSYWERTPLVNDPSVRFVVLNLSVARTRNPTISPIVGDATDLSRYADASQAVVFSNSVIEHVGDRDAQRRMAMEVRRVARRYWLQTPARWFPLEPHFLFPFFGPLPVPVKAWLVRHFDLGWRGKQPDREASYRVARSVRLLTRRELRGLFPTATISAERVFGIAKSWIVVEGWDAIDLNDQPSLDETLSPSSAP